MEVAQGRVGGRQGCNNIIFPLASRGSCANLHGAVKHRGREGDRLAGGKVAWKQYFLGLGSCHGKSSSVEYPFLFVLCWGCGARGWIRMCLGDMKLISPMVLINGKDEAGGFHLPEQVWGRQS